MELPEGRIRCALPSDLTCSEKRHGFHGFQICEIREIRGVFCGDYLKIIVLLKSVLDTKIPLECIEDSDRLKNDWNVPMLNPDDGMAVGQALKIKKDMPEAHITIVHLGPHSGDRFIRDTLALGCDDGLRIWDEGLEDLHTRGKRLIFARVAKILGFDILFTGTKSLDTGSSQLGMLLASSMQVPCITRVVCIDEIRTGTITATRKLERGYQERVESARPLVISVEADEEAATYAPFTAMAQAAEKNIPCFDLPRIGIPLQAIQQEESRLKFGPLRLPEPRLQFIQPPDSSLPAFERRRQLGEGAMEKRSGRIVRGNEDAVAEELFQTLLRKGWLEHLRRA
jgi:electron transfer flavoprotein beta subunit